MDIIIALAQATAALWIACGLVGMMLATETMWYDLWDEDESLTKRVIGTVVFGVVTTALGPFTIYIETELNAWKWQY